MALIPVTTVAGQLTPEEQQIINQIRYTGGSSKQGTLDQYFEYGGKQYVANFDTTQLPPGPGATEYYSGQKAILDIIRQGISPAPTNVPGIPIYQSPGVTPAPVQPQQPQVQPQPAQQQPQQAPQAPQPPLQAPQTAQSPQQVISPQPQAGTLLQQPQQVLQKSPNESIEQYINRVAQFYTKTPETPQNIQRQHELAQQEAQRTGTSTTTIPGQQPQINPAQKQQQVQIQQEEVSNQLSQYGVSADPQNFNTNPLQSFTQLYKDLFQSFGLSTFKEQMESLNEEIGIIDGQLADKIASINENPWISEGLRTKKISAEQEKFESKRKSLVDRATLFNTKYEQGLDQVKFLSQTALSAYYQDRTLDQNLLLKTMDLVNRETNLPSSFREFELSQQFPDFAKFLKTGKEQAGGLGILPDINDPNYIFKLMDASAGRKAPNQIETLRPIQKSIAVVNQLEGLQQSINKTITDPILGTLKKYNPYDFDARAIQAQLQAIVPNLARGVFGEVGVLTDNDIKNYIQTLPNIQSTAEQNKFVMSMTLKTVQRNLESQLETLASAGYDISGFKNQYQKVKNTVEKLEKDLGIGQTAGTTSNTNPESVPIGGTYSAGGILYLRTGADEFEPIGNVK